MRSALEIETLVKATLSHEKCIEIIESYRREVEAATVRKSAEKLERAFMAESFGPIGKEPTPLNDCCREALQTGAELILAPAPEPATPKPIGEGGTKGGE